MTSDLAAIIKRTTLIVSDAARSIAFYRDVIGMKEYYNQTMSVGGKIIPAGVPGAEVHLGIMEGPNAEVGKLGLLQWTNPPLPAAAPAKRLGIGDMVFVCETDDIHALSRRLEASPDCRIHCPLHQWEVPEADGSGSKEIHTLSFFDPDGFFFEVNHKPNEPQPDRFVIRRTTLIVPDVASALAFYRDTFGLRVWYDQEMSVEGNVLPAGEPGARVRVVILQGQTDDTGMLGLLGYLDPPLPAAPPWRPEITVGQGMFVASSVGPLAPVVERLRAAGAKIHAEPESDSVIGADGSEILLTTLSFFDPNGFFYELNERRTA